MLLFEGAVQWSFEKATSEVMVYIWQNKKPTATNITAGLFFKSIAE